MKKFYLPYLLILVLLAISCKSDDYVDNVAPSTPLNLVITNTSESSWEISWDVAIDNEGVTGYNVYLDGVLAKSTANTTATITSLITNSRYSIDVTAVDSEGNESSHSDSITCTFIGTPVFKSTLSEMGIYTQTMASLTPTRGVQLYEINSTLFTDYAKKQRLIRLPNCEKMSNAGTDLLPTFPDNTLIAKTFYYDLNENDPNLGKKIIETRVLIKIKGTWQVGNYIWNQSQSDAILNESGSQIPITYVDTTGETQNVAYIVPSKQDCFTCHNNFDKTIPIGMKLRSMNFVPSYTNQNQLDYFTTNNLLEGVTASSTSVLPDWTDASFDIFERGRAYIDINCAHCHQPGGIVPTGFLLDFRYEALFTDTGIREHRGQIEDRFISTVPTYRMPQLGRTVVHEEAKVMLLEYLEAIE